MEVHSVWRPFKMFCYAIVYKLNATIIIMEKSSLLHLESLNKT